ncbi:MAG: SprT-like domain-containing protein [Clostridia bacterium]|nr:SprT-like domain-containing protein [Clostridia bacterium]
MEDKLQALFNECKTELKNIGIDLNNKIIGRITINIAKRNCNRYGCCKQELPDESSKYIEKIGRKYYVRYAIFKKHTIEISKWVMDLNNDIIKNTIMHEIIHCLPNCNNHGEEFKKYAQYINSKLNYNISRVGDKKQDLANSNIEIKKEYYNYKIKCKNCDYFFYRKRLNTNFTKKYRCGKCGGKFIIENGKFESKISN